MSRNWSFSWQFFSRKCRHQKALHPTCLSLYFHLGNIPWALQGCWAPCCASFEEQLTSREHLLRIYQYWTLSIITESSRQCPPVTGKLRLRKIKKLVKDLNSGLIPRVHICCPVPPPCERPRLGGFRRGPGVRFWCPSQVLTQRQEQPAQQGEEQAEGPTWAKVWEEGSDRAERTRRGLAERQAEEESRSQAPPGVGEP